MVVIALLLLLAPAPAQPQGRDLHVLPAAPGLEEAYQRSWAVVVGVDRFRDRRIPPLAYAVNDARSVAQALGPLGFPADNIIVLVNEDASRAGIERVLSRVVRRASGPNDRLLIFFAMHGVTAPLPHGGEEGYLLPHDADIDDLPLTALSMQQLKQIGQRIPAKHILIAVDACYGGYSLVRSQAPPIADRRYLDLVLRSRAIQVLTAGRRDQPVIEEQGHGVFTRTLLNGLAGHADENGDGLITAAELGAWMHPRVAQRSDYKQDMQWGTLDGEGQFVFVLPGAAPSTSAPLGAPPSRPTAAPPAPAVASTTSPAPVPPRPTPTPAASEPPAPPAPAPAKTPAAPAAPTPDTRVAAIPPDPRLDVVVGTWEGLMSTRLSEALVHLVLGREGSALDGKLLLSSVRNTGSGTVGFDESFALQRRAGETTLSGVDLSGRRLFARTDDRTLVVDLRLSKDSRNLQGTISADGTIYSVFLRRR